MLPPRVACFLRPASVLLLTLGVAMFCGFVEAASLREPVHSRRNVEEFQPVDARYVRFVIRATNHGEPCLDELEIYPPGENAPNVALASSGARASASGSLPGYAIHQLEGINDGRYGNGRSWIANQERHAWVQIELPAVTRISKVVWGRDREGKFIDRLATQYQIEVAVETNAAWRVVASSEDREPLAVGAQLSGMLSITRQFVNRFAPVGTTLSPESERVSTEYTIDVWQTPDGLPGNTVTAIEQTPDGYLWVGSLNGLARFDGVRFTVFREAEGLPDARVLCLHADASGTLWIGTAKGLTALRHGEFRTWTTRDGLNHNTVSSLASDREGRLWIGTRTGLSCWQNGRFLPEVPRLVDGSRDIAKLVLDRDQTLWALAEGAMYVQQGDTMIRPRHREEPSSFTTVFAAHAGRSGQFWFGGANGYLGAMSNDAVHVFREQPGLLLGTVWELCETRNGDVWAGTANSGLRRLRQGRFTSLTTQEGLSDNSVRCLFEDREGSLWVGTLGGGLNRLKPRKVTTFTTRDGLSHNVVMSLAEDADGTLWIGSNCGGLSARRDGRIAPFYANYVLDNECIWSLLPQSDGSLWMGTWSGGLFRLQGRKVESFNVTGPDQAVVALCEDGSGGLWVGTIGGGLKRFHQGQVESFTTTNGLTSDAITSLLREQDGTLWIGTSGGGLNRMTRDGFTTFTRRHGLPGDFIRTLHLDSAGILWVGTGSGLARMGAGRIGSLTRAQGLPDEVISQILEDGRGNLWFGGNQGIFRVSRDELEAVALGRATRVNPITYGRAEGLESLECTGGFHPAGLKTRDGKLWFSTVKGLVMLDPESITANAVAPPVVLERFLVDGEPIPFSQNHQDEANARRPKPIEIGPGIQRVEFHYAGLSLVAPERNRYRYRLSRLDADWVEGGAQRVARYTHLPAGQYRFQVIASNNDGLWNNTGASLQFVVLPPFWRTWWFVTAGILVVMGGGGWAVRFASVRRLRRKLRRLEEKHAVEQERTRIAQDIHDELGASLTRIALLTELGQKHRERPDEVAADLGKISATAREAVRAMDAIVWAVNPRNDSLDHFANYVSQFAEEFLRPTNIRCRLDVPADLPERPLPTEERHQLFMAVKESLNNVVRHSGASEVWLRLRSQDGGLEIRIEDNGCGLPAGGAVGPGQDGLANIRSRVERLGGRFTAESQPGGGTRLCLRLPFSGNKKT